MPRASFTTLVSELSTSLKTFQSSGNSFSVLHRINPHSYRTTASSSPSSRLLILDSSFNPPSKAHFHLARDALTSGYTSRHLLLLFSVHNADKAPSAASFPQRLAMMVLLGQDIVASLQSTTGPESHDAPSGTPRDVQIDIGVTTKPYYTDKSLEITSSDVYKDKASADSDIQHTHILGYDTLIRFLNPKYYREEHDPPLSAVAPYFDAEHSLRVILRPGDEYSDIKEQVRFVEGIGEGSLESEGGKKQWSALIETCEVPEGSGVSSTRIREAAKDGRWEVVDELCPESVARAVREHEIYTE